MIIKRFTFILPIISAFIIGTFLSILLLEYYLSTVNKIDNPSLELSEIGNETKIIPKDNKNKFDEKRSVSFMKELKNTKEFPFKTIITKENIPQFKEYFSKKLGFINNEFIDNQGHLILYFYDESRPNEFVGYEIKLFIGRYFELKGNQVKNDGSFSQEISVSNFENLEQGDSPVRLAPVDR